LNCWLPSSHGAAPAGTTIPLDKRQRLLRLAHTYDFTIVADEVYQLLSFPGMQHLVTHGRLSD
jgi:DNA-binding transcriptional MocR family regulator